MNDFHCFPIPATGRFSLPIIRVIRHRDFANISASTAGIASAWVPAAAAPEARLGRNLAEHSLPALLSQLVTHDHGLLHASCDGVWEGLGLGVEARPTGGDAPENLHAIEWSSVGRN